MTGRWPSAGHCLACPVSSVGLGHPGHRQPTMSSLLGQSAFSDRAVPSVWDFPEERLWGAYTAQSGSLHRDSAA